MAMSLVSTVTVGSGGSASIQWTGIPQTGKDLFIVMSARSSGGGFADFSALRFNGTTSTYTAKWLYSDGTSVSSSNNWNIPFNGSSTTTSSFGNASFYVSNYTASLAKSISVDAITETNHANDAWTNVLAGAWDGTAAITSAEIVTLGSNFVQHTTASLYIVT
jgi:hypothetical protein